jgi:hypothetical protein
MTVTEAIAYSPEKVVRGTVNIPGAAVEYLYTFKGE